MPLVFTRKAQPEPKIAKAKERRSTSRYGLNLPLLYRNETGAGNARWKHGHTLNMSASGVSIELCETKPVGSQLELAIDWPGLYHDRPAMRLFLTVLVVRTDGRRLAAQILRHRFCDLPVAVAALPERRVNRAVA